jgi:hypothetical protein
MKTCTVCKEVKSFDCFYPRKDRPTVQYVPQCKACNALKAKKRYWEDPEGHKEKTKNWVKNNREKCRVIFRKHRYKISDVDYQKMKSDSAGLCAICSSSEKLFIDHDHITGKIRGLLCRTCNLGLGHMRDSALNLRKSIDYLILSSNIKTGFVGSSTYTTANTIQGL